MFPRIGDVMAIELGEQIDLCEIVPESASGKQYPASIISFSNCLLKCVGIVALCTHLSV